MEAFFRKYQSVINLGLLGMGSLLSALMVNGFVASQLAPFTVPDAPNYEAMRQQSERQSQRPDRAQSWKADITERCLFGCPEVVDPNVCPEGCGEGEVCEAGQCVPAPEGGEVGDDVPVASDLNMTLSGVMVASNPRWSMAMIKDGGQNKTMMVGVGDLIAEGAEVVEIRRDRVFVERNGQLEFIRMEGATSGDPAATASRPTANNSRTSGEVRSPTVGKSAAVKAEPTNAEATNAASGVERQGPNSFKVDRSMVERQLADPAALTRQARVMPNYRDGEPSGLRMVGVTPSSFYSQMGIRSGDIIQSVNGTPITNQRQALELLEKLRSENNVVIEIERRGRTEKMEYTIE
ncbi:PDZ domain-containing protein [Bradymonadaceae bacterium TMQ3]|nr:PDZ domain-containing protein [Bradymonadaceae bacterium TMQ3]TXC76679.1 PDZ domain-containing protein [Bradymonadales bacterium TMQ1]